MGASEAGLLLGVASGSLCVLVLGLLLVVALVLVVARRRRGRRPDREAPGSAAPVEHVAAGEVGLTTGAPAAGLTADPDERATVEPDEGSTPAQPHARTTAEPEDRVTADPDERTTVEPDERTTVEPDEPTTDAPAAPPTPEPQQPPVAGGRPIKRAHCPACGAAKVRPSTTAYLYCDYCGSLVDWDFRIACESAASALPGPAYEELAAEIQPRQEAALASGDRATYRANLRQLFDTHVTACPASYSPRVGDAVYRSALLDYTADSYTAAAFDPTCQQLDTAMSDAVGALGWSYEPDGPSVESASFRRLLDAFWAYSERFLTVSEPLLAGHPDHPTGAFTRQFAASAFLQGWLPYLDDAEQRWAIERLGLGGEYSIPEGVATTHRRCGGCGRTLEVVQGAKRVVCESCGLDSDVGHAEIRCTACGGTLSIPHGRARFPCPHCGADQRVDGIQPSWFT